MKLDWEPQKENGITNKKKRMEMVGILEIRAVKHIK